MTEHTLVHEADGRYPFNPDAREAFIAGAKWATHRNERQDDD